ncbi:MAG: class I SAM-dependent methyltransferase [Halobacteriota archaeon]|uniref:class I SAM-dependent methyltransferase n=1 Tax=Natronomonas sp. TaxID=2184060 RepID=UPI003976D350
MKDAIRNNFDASPDAYEAYERMSGRFGTLADRLYRAMSDRCAFPIETCLDAGAGSGISTRRLQAHGVTPIALDLSRSMLEENRANDRVQGDFDHLPFVADTFDSVAFTASLFLTPKPDRAASEASRVLRPDGVVGAVAPIGWMTPDGTDVFASLARQSRSPTSAEAVGDALRASFSVERGRWTFETTAEELRSLHSIPAMAARLYPRLDTDERVERARSLLDGIEGPLEQHWRWFVGV